MEVAKLGFFYTLLFFGILAAAWVNPVSLFQRFDSFWPVFF